MGSEQDSKAETRKRLQNLKAQWGVMTLSWLMKEGRRGKASLSPAKVRGARSSPAGPTPARTSASRRSAASVGRRHGISSPRPPKSAPRAASCSPPRRRSPRRSRRAYCVWSR
eukprot:6205635-Pleurochrysis_carterae.AAC.1